MNNRCGYCGGKYLKGQCIHCARKPGESPRPFIAYGPGYAGDYSTIERAQELTQIWNDRGMEPGTVYVRLDVAVAAGMDLSRLPSGEIL